VVSKLFLRTGHLSPKHQSLISDSLTATTPTEGSGAAVSHRSEHNDVSTQGHASISSHLSRHRWELEAQQTVVHKPHHALGLTSRQSNCSSSEFRDSNHRSRMIISVQEKMDSSRDFVAGRHGYSLVAVGGCVGAAHERTTGIDEVLRAWDVVGGNALEEGREKRDGNSLSSSELGKGSTLQDLQCIGAWDGCSNTSVGTSGQSNSSASESRESNH
jgi:hypothetical protein